MTRRPDNTSRWCTFQRDLLVLLACASALACTGTTRDPDSIASARGPRARQAAGTAASTGSLSWSAGGGSGSVDAEDASVEPELGVIEHDGKYVLDLGAAELQIDAAHGARITHFGHGDRNMLSGPEVDALSWGSTFWPSPQRSWTWPPVPELDSEPYSVSAEGGGVAFTSQAGERARVSVKKRVLPTALPGTVDVEYTLVNHDSEPATWAPWEITRVLPEGLTFFPSGETHVDTALPVEQRDGISWYQHVPARITGAGQRFSGDGHGGWLAHAAGRTLLLKQWSDVPVAEQAPAPEAEIALYAAPGYVELEAQGVYTRLLPEQSIVWTVRWSSHEIPDGVSVEVGSAALLELAQRMAANSAR